MDKELAADSLLTISCRFIQYDQWLTTHVDPSWKVKQVKLWFVDSGYGRAQTVTPAPPPRYRPASPITFAPDPRNRPISPILFAKSGNKGKRKSRRHEAKKTWMLLQGGSSYANGDGDDEDDGEGVGGGGYEEDDEWDSDDDESIDGAGDELDGLGGSAIYPKRLVSDASRQNPPLPASASASASASQALNMNASSSTDTTKYNTAVSTYTLLRFSTGQKLEDEYQLSFYDLAPNELLELHAHAPVQHLPPTFRLPNIDSNTSKSGHIPKSAQHTRTGSSSSLSRHQFSRSHSNVQPPHPPSIPTRIYFPALNRSSLESYIQPYWEGYVRALRIVWHEGVYTDLSSPAHGYTPNLLVGGFVPALAVMGQDPAGRDLRAMEAFVDVNSRNRGKTRVKSRTRLEWRLRWAVLRDEMLYISKDREDKTPVQAYPLSALTALHGADHLVSSSCFRQYQTDKKSNMKHASPRQPKNRNGSLPHRHGHRNASSMDSYTHHHPRGDWVSDLDSESDHGTKTTGVRISDLEGEDLKIVCIKFKAGGRVRGPFVPPSTEPRNPKKYSSTIGYGALLPSGGENGVDENRYGVTSYVMAGSYATDKGKGKKGKEKEKEKRGPSLRKSSLPTLGIGESSRTLVNLLGREKEREASKLAKAPPKNKEKEKEKNTDWRSVIAGVGAKSHRDKDKSFGMQLGISGIKKVKSKQLDKGKANDTSVPPASVAGFGYFDAGPVDEEYEILDDPDAEPEDTLENGTAVEETLGESDDDANADQDIDEDVDAGVRSDSPYSEPLPPPITQITSRSHPLQTEVINMDSGSEASLPLSSPVFRRSIGSDEEDLDNESDDRKKASAYRYGYWLDGGAETRKDRKRGGSEGHGREEDVVRETLTEPDRKRQSKVKKSVSMAKEWLEDEQERGGDDKAELYTGKEKSREKTEWLVLDMGTDLAFSSLLRILHRHIPPPMTSSFVSALPRFSTPTPPSTPTPTPTPFPSPVSPRPTQASSASFTWSPPPADDESRETGEIPRSVSTPSQQSPFQFEVPQHPPALSVLSKHAELSLHKTFGALAYPEWRMELTERAQRAGMGDVGSALRWVLWQSNRQLARDLEAVRSFKDEGAGVGVVKRRRGTLGSRSSRKYRRNIVPATAAMSSADAATLSDSEASEETGKLIVGSDSEEESSEAEWQGWMADLSRQQKVQAQAKRALADAAAAAAENPVDFEEGDRVVEPPKTPAEDRRHQLEKRRALEPFGVVTTLHPNTPPSSTVLSTPSTTLYTPSSSESLAPHQRTRALSFSPEGASSSHGHPGSRPISPLAIPHTQTQPGQSLSHSTSMYSGLRSTSGTNEQSLRRPSMPTLVTEQTFSTDTVPRLSNTNMRTPGPLSDYTFPQPQAGSSSSPPQFTLPFAGEAPSTSRTSTNNVVSSSSSAFRGKTSTTGLGSLGRSSSIFGRSNNVLRKDADRSREREREEKRGKDREDKSRDKVKVKEKEREREQTQTQTNLNPTIVKEGSHKPQRPRLSVATPSSSQQTTPHFDSHSPRPVPKPKPSILRRVRSGSSLKSPEEEQEPPSPIAGGFGKKKKGVFVDRIVRGLDSALENL